MPICKSAAFAARGAVNSPAHSKKKSARRALLEVKGAGCALHLSYLLSASTRKFPGIGAFHQRVVRNLNYSIDCNAGVFAEESKGKLRPGRG